MFYIFILRVVVEEGVNQTAVVSVEMRRQELGGARGTEPFTADRGGKVKACVALSSLKEGA